VIHRSPHPAPVIPDLPFVEVVLDRIAAQDDAVALIDGATGERTTFAELLAAVDAHAAGLALHVRPGDAVAIVAGNEPRWPVAFLAALAAGVTAVPLNPALTEHELADLFSTAAVRAVITNAAALPAVQAAAARAGTRSVFALSADAHGCAVDLLPSAPGGRPVVHRGPADVAVLPFSSGTTGRPKGVCLSDRNLLAGLVQHEHLQVLGSGDVLLGALPFFHIYGLMLVLVAAISRGAAVVTMDRFDLPRFLALIEAHRVTRLHIAPPIVRALALAPEVVDHDLGSVVLAQCGAAPLDPGLIARASARAGFPIVQGYGMTEASPGISFTADADIGTTPRGSVGRLIPGTEARLDPDPGSGTGELWVRGPQVMAGYLDAPEASAATIDEDGWMRTGDIVRIDGGGHLFVVDRVKDLIKYKGFQVAPAELEGVLLEHEGVADAAVVGVPDDEAGEIPKGFVVARPGADLDPAELLSWVAGRVAPYKKLRAVAVVDEIPRSPAGKVLRRSLRDRS
jgi:acyl-CoA synthetase (AMP-forming)/AMP-acid ligase II